MPFILELRDAPSDEVLAHFVGEVPLPVPERGEAIEFTRHLKNGKVDTFKGTIDRRVYTYTPVPFEVPAAPSAMPEFKDQKLLRWTLEIRATVWLTQSSS